MNTTHWIASCVCFTFAVSLAACAPKIYVIDQHTVLEQEAAGDWPEFERQLLRGSAEATPTTFRKVDVSPRKARLYNVLNDEFLSAGAAAAKPTIRR